MVRIPKSFGNYKVESCFFCGQDSRNFNSQGVPVCPNHLKHLIPDMKCACGKYLDARKGKFGLFFTCDACGIVNTARAKNINSEILFDYLKNPRFEKNISVEKVCSTNQKKVRLFFDKKTNKYVSVEDGIIERGSEISDIAHETEAVFVSNDDLDDLKSIFDDLDDVELFDDSKYEILK